MSEATPYFDAITARRSMLIQDPFDAQTTTISLETQADLQRDTVCVALQDHFGSLLPYLKWLDQEDRELIALYYHAEKPQWCLATYHRSTQTLCSQRLRLAIKRLGILAIHKGHPDLEALDAVLEDHGLNHQMPGGITTGRLVVEYRTHRSFSAMTEALGGCHRPMARRALISSAAALLRDEHEEHTAYGAYIHGLIDQASVLGAGYADNRRMKCAAVMYMGTLGMVLEVLGHQLPGAAPGAAVRAA